MPPLSGFSDNPFLTHADLITASKSLLRPLHAYKSPQGARIKVPIETGTHFDETAAQLEGFARSLWAVGCLLSPANRDHHSDPELLTFPKGLVAGTTPGLEEEYWGDVQDTDQRMVEMEILSFALLAAPEKFWPSWEEGEGTDEVRRVEVESQRRNIVRWLQGINGKGIPTTNWLWFRVLTNLALVKTCGVPYEDLKESIQADFEVLDKFEMKGMNGWNSDGIWSDDGRQADYYSGSFAIQYSQLLFVRFASDIDPERAEKYRKRAGMFALDFIRYFDKNGASIPFGRSLTYRFAMGAFWSIVAFAEVPLPAPLDKYGVIKGLLLRHLRQWAAQPGIFNGDGTLSIGYHYPNSYMCEDYNSPQSVYWCLKTLIAMGLPASHSFWAAEELPHPLHTDDLNLQVAPIKAPLQITCDTGNHHFLLSSGQFCPWPLKATEAKYGKFAYSSSFGFSVPTGTLIQQLAPDSTLALSNDEGETWRMRWKSIDPRFEAVSLSAGNAGSKENIEVLKSSWKPWKFEDIVVETTLIPPTKRWPDWHVRIHKIVSKAGKPIKAMEGGFAIFGRQKANGLNVRDMDIEQLSAEGKLETKGAALVTSSAGVSGIKDLGSTKISHGFVLKPDSNTNLICQRTLIPMLKSNLDSDKSDKNVIYILITGIFAVAAKGYMVNMSMDEIKKKWEDIPVVSLTGGDSQVEGFHVSP
ncbi:hypothetical protein B0O99DRAFT_507376 [Bisporella sp. PMI_857]|nr:hypothetical protein B0O99DRAFT_507376 [Bisporella sp. PMI_857]